MFNKQPDTTIQNEAPHSRRRGSAALAFSLAPAAVVACAVLLIGIFTIPPRYVAHAVFEVDWNVLRSVSNDAMMEAVHSDKRAAFIAEMIRLPDSEQGLSELLDHVDDLKGSQADKAAVMAKLQKRLRVSLTGQTDNGDQFTIETRDDEPGAARASANRVLQGIVSKLKAGANAGGSSAAWHSLAGAESGSQSNLDEAPVASVVKTINEAQVEKRGAGYGLNVLLAAVGLGGMAGGLGLLLRQLILAITALKVVAEGASRRARSQSSANGRSAGRRRIQTPQRPILLSPLPQYCASDDLQRVDSLSGVRQ